MISVENSSGTRKPPAVATPSLFAFSARRRSPCTRRRLLVAEDRGEHELAEAEGPLVGALALEVLEAAALRFARAKTLCCSDWPGTMSRRRGLEAY
jgi:hypothetical protein